MAWYVAFYGLIRSSYGLLAATDADLACAPTTATGHLGRARSPWTSTNMTVQDYAGPDEGFTIRGTAARCSNQRSTAANGASNSTQPLALGVRIIFPGQLFEVHR